MKDFLQVIGDDDSIYMINRAHIVYVRPWGGESFSDDGALIVINTGSDTKQVCVNAGEQTQTVLNFVGFVP